MWIIAIENGLSINKLIWYKSSTSQQFIYQNFFTNMNGICVLCALCVFAYGINNEIYAKAQCTMKYIWKQVVTKLNSHFNMIMLQLENQEVAFQLTMRSYIMYNHHANIFLNIDVKTRKLPKTRNNIFHLLNRLKKENSMIERKFNDWKTRNLVLWCFQKNLWS